MNKIRLITISLFLVLLNISTDTAAVESNSTIYVASPYVRATIPGTDITSAYLTIENRSNKTATFTGASSLVSDRIEIHQHTMSDGMMKMRHVKQLTIEENGQVTLQPMGYHLMIFNVKKVLQPEDEISVTLHFTEQKDVTVTFPVQSIKQVNKQHHHH
jgi:copper(I)-binding protein